jgi:hypothetical protein
MSRVGSFFASLSPNSPSPNFMGYFRAASAQPTGQFDAPHLTAQSAGGESVVYDEDGYPMPRHHYHHDEEDDHEPEVLVQVHEHESDLDHRDVEHYYYDDDAEEYRYDPDSPNPPPPDLIQVTDPSGALSPVSNAGNMLFHQHQQQQQQHRPPPLPLSFGSFGAPGAATMGTPMGSARQMLSPAPAPNHSNDALSPAGMSARLGSAFGFGQTLSPAPQAQAQGRHRPASLHNLGPYTSNNAYGTFQPQSGLGQGGLTPGGPTLGGGGGSALIEHHTPSPGGIHIEKRGFDERFVRGVWRTRILGAVLGVGVLLGECVFDSPLCSEIGCADQYFVFLCLRL